MIYLWCPNYNTTVQQLFLFVIWAVLVSQNQFHMACLFWDIQLHSASLIQKINCVDFAPELVTGQIAKGVYPIESITIWHESVPAVKVLKKI